MKRMGIILLSMAIMLGTAVPAAAQFAPVDPFNYGPYSAVCSGQAKAPPEVRIQACTAFMRSKEYYFNAWPYVGRAFAERDAGNLSAALTDTENAIKVSEAEFVGDPGRVDAYGLQAWILVKTNGSLDRALDDCNKASERAPSNMNVVDLRGFVHYHMGDYAAAIADFDTVEKAGLLSPGSLDARGRAKIKNGDTAGGNADRAAAIQRASAGDNHKYAGYGMSIDDVKQQN